MTDLTPVTKVQQITGFKAADLHDLCDATDAAIIDGGGFGWVKPPRREVMERYWRGVLVVPERTLFVGRLDNVICGSAQLVRPAPNAEAQVFSAQLTTAFVAPWARGHGIAQGLTQAVEDLARDDGYQVLNLDVRETQRAAIALYERLGFQKWGEHPFYAFVGGRMLRGLYYYKELVPAGVTPSSDQEASA